MNPNNVKERDTAFDLSTDNKFSFRPFPQNTRIVILLLIIFGTFLRLRNLGESLWFDETLYSTKYWMPSWSDLWRLFLFDPPAPLYRVFMFFWTTMFGEHELFLRVPSLLFGISSILLTYLIAETYDSLKMAVLAALLLSLSPVHIWYSQEATPYSMTLFFLLATVFVFRRLRTDHSNLTWCILYLVFFLIAVFTHYYAAIFLLPLSLLTLTEERSTRRRMIAVNSVVILCLVTTLGIKYMAGSLVTGFGLLRPFTLFEWWMLFLNWFSHGNSLWTVNPYYASKLGSQYLMSQPLLVVFQVIFLLILLRGLMPRSGRVGWKQTWELSLFLFSMPLFMLFLTRIGYRHLYIERYLFLTLPFFLIVVARGASGLSRMKLEIATMLFLVIVGVASCSVFFYKNYTWTVYKQNPDWRSAASYLIQENSASDKSVVLHVTFADTLIYYFRRDGIDAFKVKQAEDLASLLSTENLKTFYLIRIKQAEDLTSLLSTENLKTFYLINNVYWRGKFDEVFLKIKEDRNFRLVSSHTFKGLEVYIFTNSA